MTSNDFVHLHVHTTHSFLDGMCPPRALAARAAALGQPAVAVTDHGHMGAAIATYRACRDAGIRAIIGMEAYTADFGHLVLLAATREGYDNLRALATIQARASLDVDDIAGHVSGLVVTTACVANRVTAHVARGDMTAARGALTALTSVVGRQRLFLELQPTAGPHLRANAGLQQLARDTGLGCVVTNDVHYLSPRDHEPQNVLMAIRQGKRLRDKGLHQHPAPVYYLRSAAEMAAACDAAGIDSSWLATTAEVAAGCDVDLDLGVPDLPPFSENDDGALRMYVGRGMRRRGKQTGVDYDDFDGPYGRRVEEELSIITDMGYSGYFLIVADFVDWARNNGCYVGPGRGSGAGSLVAYYLGITDLDPIEHKLFFERFLNPERVSMPDFDIDFMQARRGAVIDYVVERWGRDHVGQIATYMSLHPKSAIKDAGRAMGIGYAELNAMTKSIPAIIKPHTDEERAMDEFTLAMTYAKELTAAAATDAVYGRLVATARALTGCVRQTGKHAGGVVIGRLPLSAYTPLTDDGRTQYDMNDVEAAGLVKFDFLGLKTLDVIAGACQLADVDVRGLALDDEAVYAGIAAGDTWGLFQVESTGMTKLCRDLVPDRFDDIVAAVALYRPGPMESGMLDSFIARKHGREDVEYAHPDLESILDDTYGTIVYQEQVMQAAQALAGYSLGGADLLRRAMGKKKPAEMAKQRRVWLDGCADNGIDTALAGEIFDAIEKFAGYGFNRAHAAAYALITYQTAWLKTHHRLPFAAALLTVESGDQDKLSHYARQIRSSGIALLPPDVNASGREFRVEAGTGLRWGLGAVKGLGDAALEPLLAGAPYADVYDLAERSRLPKAVLKTLVDSGACDGLHADGSRAAMRAALDAGTARGRAAAAADVAGQTDMLGLLNVTATPLPAGVGADDRGTELDAERRLLGSYVSGHPMAGIGAITPSTWTARDPWVSGVVVDVFTRTAKKSGKLWAKVTIEDEGEHMRALAFPDAYEAVGDVLAPGAVVTLYGRANDDGEFIVDDARPFDNETDNEDDD